MDTVLLLLVGLLIAGLVFALPTIIRDWRRTRSGHK